MDFAASLTGGPWYLHVPGQGYVAPSGATNTSPYLSLAPTRAQACHILVAQEPDSTHGVRANLVDTVSNRYLGVNRRREVVLGGYDPDGIFLLTRRRPNLFTIAWAGENSRSSLYLAYNTVTRRFDVVSGSRPVPTDQPALFQAVNAQATGGPLWTRQFGEKALGAPASFGSYQVIAGDTPMLTCFDMSTGQPAWVFEPDSAATCPVAVNWTTRVAVVASGTEVYVVSMDTGQKLRLITTEHPVTTRPLTIGDQIFVCDSGGVLHCISTSGDSARWTFSAGAAGRPLTTPALMHGHLYLGSSDGNVYAVDAPSGRQTWQTPTGAGVSAPVLATARGVYAANDQGTVVALDPFTGAEAWRRQMTVRGGVLGRPAIHADKLLVAGLSGTLTAFDAAPGKTGDTLWTVTLDGTVEADVTVSDHAAYVVTKPGALHVVAVDPAQPPPPLTFDLGGESAGGVTVYSGSVNTVRADGHGYALPSGLRADLRPVDCSAALYACALADIAFRQAPPVPPSWRVDGSFQPDGDDHYGRVRAFSMQRPSDDAPLRVIAFGITMGRFVDHYDPTAVQLTPLDFGDGAEQARVTDTVLANYLPLRAWVHDTVDPDDGELLFTGHGQGGALAALAALDFTRLHPDIPLTCITFGAPPVGDADFVRLFMTDVRSSTQLVAPADPTVTSLGDPWWLLPRRVTVGEGFANPSAGMSTYARYLAGTV